VSTNLHILIIVIVFYSNHKCSPDAKLIAEQATKTQPKVFRSISKASFAFRQAHHEIPKFIKITNRFIVFFPSLNKRNNTPTTEKCVSFSSNNNYDNSQITPYNDKTNPITQIRIPPIKTKVPPIKSSASPRVRKNQLRLSANPNSSHTIPISLSMSLGSSQTASKRSDFDNRSVKTPIPYAVIPYPVFLHRYSDPLYP
jgi:hypothetical protein